MSADTDPPTVSKVTVRNYRPAPQIGEGGAFAVSIYLDGKQAGRASNEGRGGSNRYEFDSRANRDAFFASAEAWATEHGKDTGEPADALINELCDEFEFTKAAKRLVRRGAETVILIEKGPGWFTEDHTGEPDYYDSTYLVGLPKGTDPETVATAEDAHKWRVIPTE
jgi:hypothetical protein